jgi:hypothetical protein
MELELSWDITSIKTQNMTIGEKELSNVVIYATWRLTGTDENKNTGTFNGATPFDTTSIDVDSCLQYDSLKPDNVISWIQSEIDNSPSYKDHVLEQIQTQIDNSKIVVTDVSGDKLPWAPIIDTNINGENNVKS